MSQIFFGNQLSQLQQNLIILVKLLEKQQWSQDDKSETC